MLKNIKTAGELQESRFVTGEITALDHSLDSCSISIEGSSYSDVPIFYHCNPTAVETSTGAIKGGSWGFAVGDKAVVLVQVSITNLSRFVIGHKYGARTCAPLLILYSSESGEEAVIWDILNDQSVSTIDTLSNLQTILTEWGVTDQTECLPDDVREYCYNDFGVVHPQKFETDLPCFDITISEDPPFIVGADPPYVDLLDYGDLNSTCAGYDYHFAQSYYINPVVTKDQTPRPGMWVADISGVIPIGDWDTVNWGVCPLEYGQSWKIDPDTGLPSERYNVNQAYYFFRSIFDIKLNGGSVVIPYSTQLTVHNLSLSTTLVYQFTRDGEYYHVDTDIDLATWLLAGYTENRYDYYMELTDYGLHPDNITHWGPAFHLLIPHIPMWDKTTGSATNGESTILFEHLNVYPSKYGFYEADKIWDSSMVSKLKQAFRLYYRHPYFKKNMDAVLFEKVNEERVALGREPLELNWNLYKAAQGFSDDMAGRLSTAPLHVGSDGSMIQERTEDAGFALNTYLTGNNLFGVGENVFAAPVGLGWQIERVVDNSDINIPKTYISEVTNTVKDLAVDDFQLSHNYDGIITIASGDGWKQSPSHYATFSEPGFTDTGMATQAEENGQIYISQDFGVIGDPNDFTDQTKQHWPGFASFDTTKLLTYVNDNFVFDKVNGDEHRVPKIDLCTMPQ